MPNKLLNSRSMTDPQDTYVLRGIYPSVLHAHIENSVGDDIGFVLGVC